MSEVPSHVEQLASNAEAQTAQAAEVRSALATVVASESELSPAVVENPLAGASASAEKIAAYKAAVDPVVAKVRKRFRSTLLSFFALGDALIELRQALESVGEKPTNAKLATCVGIGELTPQRIGDYMATAEFYPPEVRDEGISFRAFEDARKAAQRGGINLPVKVVSQVLKNNPSGAKVKAAIDRMAVLNLSVINTPGEGKDGNPEAYYVSLDETSNVSPTLAMGAMVAIARLQKMVDRYLSRPGDIERLARNIKFAPEELHVAILNNLRVRVGFPKGDKAKSEALATIRALLETAKGTDAPDAADDLGSGAPDESESDAEATSL